MSRSRMVVCWSRSRLVMWVEVENGRVGQGQDWSCGLRSRMVVCAKVKDSSVGQGQGW